MPDPIPAAASSLPRTLEMALKICDFDATVWARRPARPATVSHPDTRPNSGAAL